MTLKDPYIVVNSATCLKCGDEIVSKSRHDFVSCTCGAIAVDGGQHYMRRVMAEPGAIKDTSIIMEKADFMFLVATVKDINTTFPEPIHIDIFKMSILKGLLTTDNLTVITQEDVFKQLLTYHGESVTKAIEWARDTGRNEYGMVNAVVRAVHIAGFLRDKNEKRKLDV